MYLATHIQDKVINESIYVTRYNFVRIDNAQGFIALNNEVIAHNSHDGLIFIPAYSSVGISMCKIDDSKDIEIQNISLSHPEFEEYVHQLCLNKQHNVFGYQIKLEKAIHLYDELIQLSKEKRILIYRSLLLPFIQEVAKECHILHQPYRKREAQKMDAVMEVLQADLSRDWHMKDVAKEIAVSEMTLYRILSHAGTRFNKLLNSLRLKEAFVRIHRGEQATQVAKECGFKHYSYFSRVFKEHYGIAPSEVKKQNFLFSE